MGGVSRSDPRGDGRGVGPAGESGSPAQVQEEHPRPEETAAREAEWSQDQTRRYIEDPGSTKSVHNMTPLRGWVRATHQSQSLAHWCVALRSTHPTRRPTPDFGTVPIFRSGSVSQGDVVAYDTPGFPSDRHPQ